MFDKKMMIIFLSISAVAYHDWLKNTPEQL